MERRLEILAKLDEVREACDFVVEAAQDAGLDARAVYHCEMAVDEICTNVVEHGYGYAGNSAKIIITTRIEEGCFQIMISDRSPRFDPTVQRVPDLKSEDVKMQPGGWGIYFVKELMDEFRYQYYDEQNHLTLVKCLPQDVEVLDNEGDVNLTISEAQKGFWSVEVAGRLDGSSSTAFLNRMGDYLKQANYRVIVDMAGVDYVSSSGLKVLASLWRDANDHSGKLMLVGLNARLLEIFDMVGFTTFIGIYGDVNEALTQA